MAVGGYSELCRLRRCLLWGYSVNGVPWVSTATLTGDTRGGPAQGGSTAIRKPTRDSLQKEGTRSVQDHRSGCPSSLRFT